ncbi:MAG: glycosyltransferase family 2 protein [Methanoculleaceae archaeon]
MISVVIPAFHEEAHIRRCLESLEQQTLDREEYEVIVVDGGSTDRTREIAEELADMVFVQTSPKVGGARNDGACSSRGDVIATTDADCILPPDWLARIRRHFEGPSPPVQLYGPVYPIEPGLKNALYLWCANTFSRIGYVTGLLYYTLGCNSAFGREAFFRAGMYRCLDAGDDLEIALRMKGLGEVRYDPHLKVGFSMRRYQQFGTIRSLYEWLSIVREGGNSERYTYTRRKYR